MTETLTAPAYAHLPNDLHTALHVTRFPEPAIFALNTALAGGLGLQAEALSPALLSGAQTVHGEKPLAMAYAGHQFGNYAPLLGDGRAMLIADIIDPAGHAHELHLKGSGLTPYSRAERRFAVSAA
ncbi:MAG: protein adenylyltransferase SelO family protein, partial [Pseudomonadota bacterium]